MKLVVIVVLAMALSCLASDSSSEYDELEASLNIDKTCKHPHEVYDDCGSACEMTCENWQPEPLVCIRKCDPGCFCDSAHIRSNATGLCIPKGKCWTIVKAQS
nr:cysteine-rich venom protein 6-like [Aedes albopictus]